MAEARELREDLAAGLSVAEICARHGWREWTYQRRMRVARKLARQEYDPERVFDIFMRYEARYRAFQAGAVALAKVLDEYLAKRVKSPQANKVAMVAHARVAVDRLVADWEDRIIETARKLGIILPPSQGRERDGQVRWTFEEFARAATIGNEQSKDAR
jgi:hypothetical protein